MKQQAKEDCINTMILWKEGIEMKKRISAMCLTMAMLLSMLCVQAFAAEKNMMDVVEPYMITNSSYVKSMPSNGANSIEIAF